MAVSERCAETQQKPAAASCKLFAYTYGTQQMVSSNLSTSVFFQHLLSRNTDYQHYCADDSDSRLDLYTLGPITWVRWKKKELLSYRKIYQYTRIVSLVHEVQQLGNVGREEAQSVWHRTVSSTVHINNIQHALAVIRTLNKSNKQTHIIELRYGTGTKLNVQVCNGWDV